MNRQQLLRHLNYYTPAGVLFLIYILTGHLGLSIQPLNTFVTLVWPPSGIALAALVLYGYRLWPAIALGALVLNVSVGATIFVGLGIALGNTLEAVVGAYILKQYVGFNPNFLRSRDNLGLVTIALTATTISATIGVTSLWLGGALLTQDLLITWGSWWIGDAIGILVIAPLIFKWLAMKESTRTPAQYVELVVVNFFVLLVSIFTFWAPQTQLAYYLFLPLTWAALRTGPRGMTLAIFISSVVALTGTLAGHGPFVEGGLIYLQIFIGTLSSLFLIFTAVVEDRKRAQDLLAKHVNELERALHKVSSEDEAKKDFLAILAHELRNPLAAILSAAELLRLREVHAPDTLKLLQTIDERVRGMTRMLDDLLDLSRISRNKLTLRKESVSVDVVIDRAVRAAQSFIRSRGHTLSVVKPDHEFFLDADPIRLEQIFVNLLNNAAKYTKSGGSIKLTAAREDFFVAIKVIDNGIGIPRQILKQIFEPFFQAERGQLETEGLGVGLPLTRQLVEMHGGIIEVESEGEGRGSQFTVRLPLPKEHRAPTTKAPPRTNRALRRSKQTRTILVVDDNEIAADSLGRLLELRGHEVAIAYSGNEALAKAHELKPHIIILDIGLPDIDGYEVMRRLQEEKGFSSAVIALTGYGQPQDKERALEAGFMLHLTKPVGLKEIEAAFRKVLRSTGAGESVHA